MKMSSFWWNLVVLFVVHFVKAKCESTAYPVIPNHLLECYMDDGIYHRANRLPDSFDSFLDLVRKVEESPTSRNMNARELALALLHYLKLDGIQSIRSYTNYFSSNILPFAPSGGEYFKHRLTLVGLIPRIDHGYLTAFNETLTKKQMCNLHFKLSYSIDPYKRNDERCTPLFESKREDGSNPRSGWDSYQNINSYYRRNKRHIEQEENRNGLYTRSKKMTYNPGVEMPKVTTELDEKKQRKLLQRQTQERLKEISIHAEIKKKDSLKNVGDALQRERRNLEGLKGKELEAEIIPTEQHTNSLKKLSQEEKSKFTIGDQELLSAGELRPKIGMQSLIQVGNFGKYGGRSHAKSAHSTEESFYSGIIPGIPLSDCPVVNGVITTPFGSLTIGAVIAGIAAGLNPEEISPAKLSVDIADLESPSDKVKNIWATTLAGTVADTISSSALLDMDNFQILKGGWNDSSDSKWYLLASNQFKYITEVSLRGSLDGLLLGIHAKEWTNRFPSFKLSQMLQTYYDCCWGTVGAKYRVQLRSKYVPDEVFRKQVHLMSLVLKKQKTNVLTVLDYTQIAREAVGKVIQHIQVMDDKDKSYIGSYMSTKIENSVNLIAVIDSSWGHKTLNQIFGVLRHAQVANTIGNNLTVVCGKDGKVLSSTDNSADFHSRFTKDMLLDNCPRGMNLPLIFDSLDTIYRKIFYDEKISQKMNTDAQVAVLFPFESLLQDNSYVIEKSKNFRNNFPDVRLMIASNGRVDSFLPLVNSPKDLFPLVFSSSDSNLKSMEEFADGVKQSYQRISRPSCGSYFDDDSPGTEIRVTGEIGSNKIVHYRLLPQYFYTQYGQAMVTIKSKMRAPLTICHSRTMERPALPTPRTDSGFDHSYNQSPDYSPDFPPEANPYGKQINDETECKTIISEIYNIEMNNPCDGASSIRECLPLYISLSTPLQETVSILCQTCKLPTNVQYEITATGLTCYNSATTALISSFLFFLLFISYSFNY